MLSLARLGSASWDPSRSEASEDVSEIDRMEVSTYFVPRIHRCLTAPEWRHLEGIGKSKQALRIGTMFSGTDGLMPYLAKLSSMVGFALDHRFACDSSANSQQWIRHMGTAARIFREAAELGDGKAYDCLTESMQEVESVDVLVAGFPCKDLSGLNVQSAARAHCLIEGSHSSGSGFQHLLAYTKKFKPQLVVLENVSAITLETSGVKREGVHLYDEMQDAERIAKSNAEVVVASLQSAGYACSYLHVNTREFGLPQNRPRVYFIASSGRQTVTQQDMDQACEVVYRIKLPLLPMSVFLLDDEDPILGAYRSAAQAPAQVGRRVRRRASDASSQASVAASPAIEAPAVASEAPPAVEAPAPLAMGPPVAAPAKRRRRMGLLAHIRSLKRPAAAEAAPAAAQLLKRPAAACEAEEEVADASKVDQAACENVVAASPTHGEATTSESNSSSSASLPDEAGGTQPPRKQDRDSPREKRKNRRRPILRVFSREPQTSPIAHH